MMGLEVGPSSKAMGSEKFKSLPWFKKSLRPTSTFASFSALLVSKG